MPSLSSTLAPLLIAAGLAGTLIPPPGQTVDRTGPVQPVAALAWAQANCDSMLTARDGTRRIQAEDLMRVASMYDTMRAEKGAAAACRHARMLALGDSRSGSRPSSAGF
ncbi:MAG: hypothetical protein HOP09_07655 [Hyphomicrobium sp.]|nr:hypothetical protein [Hyphomicrobium sp.]